MAPSEDLDAKVEDIGNRLVALETNRERDGDLLKEVREQVSDMARDVSEIKIALAKGRGGIGVALWLIAGLGGASGWVMVVYNILKSSNARLAP